MTGFQEQEWSSKPAKRKAKAVWNAFRSTYGSPPTLMQYKPPNKWEIDEEGNKVWRQRAKWVIHHELGMFTFNGKGKDVAREIFIKTDPIG